MNSHGSVHFRYGCMNWYASSFCVFTSVHCFPEKRFRAQPCGGNSLIHHERDGKVAMSSFGNPGHGETKTLDSWTDLKSVVGDPKRIQKGVLCSFNVSTLSDQHADRRTHALTLALFQLRVCSILGSYGFKKRG